MIMEKKEIVKKLLDNGILISPEELENIDENNIDDFIKSKLSQRGNEIMVKISKNDVKKKLWVKDVIEFYINKLENIKKIISQKIEVVSINKIRGLDQNSCVVGIVTEITPRGFVIQDTTGRVEVISKHKPEIDDVIGVKGISREKTIFETEIIYPDIPLSRKIGKIKNAKILLTENMINTTENIDFVITPSSKTRSKRIITDLGNPCFIEMKRGEESVNILVYIPPENIDMETAKNLLRKRHLLLKRYQINSNKDNFFIDVVPDIFWVLTETDDVSIYKGVFIILGKGPFQLDLENKKLY